MMSNNKLEGKTKKKMTRTEKNRLFLKVAGWIMAIIMIVGTLLSIILPLAAR